MQAAPHLTPETTLVLVHGAWHSRQCMERFFAPYFRSQGMATHTLDLTGHGERKRETHINRVTVRDYVNDVRNAVEKITGRVVLVGHSMGALAVEKYLQEEQVDVDGAIFLTPIPTMGISTFTLKTLATKLHAWLSLLSTNLKYVVDTPDKVRKLFFSEEADNQIIQECFESLGNESFLAFLQMLIPRLRIGDLLVDHKLVISADQDALFSVKDGAANAKAYRADFEVIEGSGHDVMLDIKWEQVAQMMMRWLEKKQLIHSIANTSQIRMGA